MIIKVRNAQNKVSIDPAWVGIMRTCVWQILKMFGSRGEVSITLVDDVKIKHLNTRYRKKNSVTDVLSFPIDDILLGEIVINLERAALQAKEYRHTFERELGFLAVHGMLHLLGFDHQTPKEERNMRNIARSVLSSNGLKR